jgi:mannose-6-phosphate isomerase-like protein (cupin superfamily)
MTAPKIMRIENAESTTMRYDRGRTHHLVGPADGAEKMDVHINVINTDSGIGPYHFHEKAENVYIVLDGIAQAVVDGKRYLLVKDDVAFIPPGVQHAAGSAGFGQVRVIEIYAPAGRDFHIVDDPADVVDVERPEIAHLLPEQVRTSGSA